MIRLQNSSQGTSKDKATHCGGVAAAVTARYNLSPRRYVQALNVSCVDFKP